MSKERDSDVVESAKLPVDTVANGCDGDGARAEETQESVQTEDDSFNQRRRRMQSRYRNEGILI